MYLDPRFADQSQSGMVAAYLAAYHRSARSG